MWRKPTGVPLFDRMLRNLLAFTMPRPGLFRLSLLAARLARPFAPVFGARIAAMLKLVPRRSPPQQALGAPGTYPAEGTKRGRVALLMGCVQSVLEPSINAATIRLLTRLGFEVVVSGEEACCGSLTHHMGKEQDALARARRSIDQWLKAEVDAVVITASGCGTTIKDYGHMLRLDPAYAEKAKHISAIARDISEFLSVADLPDVKAPRPLRIAYHSACSMQHGQNIKTVPQALLAQGRLRGHRSAGGPSLLRFGRYLQHPAARPSPRSFATARSPISNPLAPTPSPPAISAASPRSRGGTVIPILHTVELLDWAHGGPIPQALVRDSGER